MFLASLTRSQQRACFHLAYSVVVSDGELAAGEDQLMAEMRREMALPDDFEAGYIAVEGQKQVFDTRRAQTIVLITLVRLAYADGAFEIEEQCFIHDLANEFDLSDNEFRLIDNWVKRLRSLQEEAWTLMGHR